jgi:hypothetical protein
MTTTETTQQNDQPPVPTEVKHTDLLVPMTAKLKLETISDCLCTAFEGGSNYWYNIEKFIRPVNFNNTPSEDVNFRHLSYPMNEGGALIISAANAEDEPEEGEELQTWRLDLESIVKGLALMALKYPRHYNDLISGNDDSDTGDVFLQTCLFGETIYG